MVHLARIMLELWISMRSRAGYPEVRRMLNPLHGRDGELTSLRQHLSRLRGGAGTSSLIEGRRGRATAPDIDEHGSTISRTLGFFTEAVSWVVHKISSGHRKGTDSILGLVVFTAAA
jgi:hypothetical protein